MHGKKRWSEKTSQHMAYSQDPSNVPRIIYDSILRHPYDVIGSLLHKRGWSEERAVKRWISQYECARVLLHAPWMLTVYYEDLVVAPQEQMDSIFRFLGEKTIEDVEELLMKSSYTTMALHATQGRNSQGLSKNVEVQRRISHRMLSAVGST